MGVCAGLALIGAIAGWTAANASEHI